MRIREKRKRGEREKEKKSHAHTHTHIWTQTRTHALTYSRLMLYIHTQWIPTVSSFFLGRLPLSPRVPAIARCIRLPTLPPCYYPVADRLPRVFYFISILPVRSSVFFLSLPLFHLYIFFSCLYFIFHFLSFLLFCRKRTGKKMGDVNAPHSHRTLYKYITQYF